MQESSSRRRIILKKRPLDLAVRKALGTFKSNVLVNLNEVKARCSGLGSK